MDESRSHLPLLILLAAAAALFFTGLDCALLEPEEARYAEIPREMLAAGEWVVPRHHGQAYYDKPPLLYWLVMLSYSAFGVHDWAARLVPGSCGVLMVLLAYDWGRRAFGPRAGFLGALVLALMPRFVYLGRFVATDAPLSLCVTAALMGVHLTIRGPSFRWGWWVLGAVTCGFGLLAKGPVVFVLVGLPALALVVLDRRGARPSTPACLAFLGVALLTASPWYIAVMLRDPAFAEYFFWKHHVVRYVAPFDHAKPFLFYLPDLAAGTLPWSLLLLPLAARLWRSRAEFRERRPPTVLFPLLAASWCVAFFSASGSKRVGYVLPALVPLALAIGEQIDHFLRRWETVREPAAWLRALPAVALLLGGGGAAALAAFAYCPPAAGLLVGGVLFGAAVAVLAYRRRIAPRAAFTAAAAVVFAGCLAGINWVLPKYTERFALRTEVRSASAGLPSDTPVVCYPRGADSVSFYLGRDDVLTFGEGQRAALLAYLRDHPDALLFLRDGEPAQWLLHDLKPLTFVEFARRGRTSAGRLRLAAGAGWAYNSAGTPENFAGGD
jgi:4-amino-4-deoxy-L-arabinose transferase-like glycosyltransferase